MRQRTSSRRRRLARSGRSETWWNWYGQWVLRFPHERNHRVRDLPRKRTERLAPHRQGLLARPRGVRRVLPGLLRRAVELGGRGPARGPWLSRGRAAARHGEALDGAGAVGAAHVLPVLERDQGPRGQSRARRANSPARPDVTGLPG